jgi:hypothetical protein
VSGGVGALSDDRLDELSKAAASTTSRGGALKLLAGGLVGGLLSAGFFGRISGAHAGGNGCLPVGFFCKTSGTCCNEPTHTCCCQLPKNTFGVCMDRDACEAAGGSCNRPLPL